MLCPALAVRRDHSWDAKAHFYPQLAFLAGALANGESAFWTPFIFTGWPQSRRSAILIFRADLFVAALLGPEPRSVSPMASCLRHCSPGAMGVLLYFPRSRLAFRGGLLRARLRLRRLGSLAHPACRTGAQPRGFAGLFALVAALDRGSVGWGLLPASLRR